MVGTKGKSGVYIRTESNKRNLSKSFNKKCLDNLNVYKKGNIPWHNKTKGKINNGFKKGSTPWIKGRKLTDIEKRNISLKTREAMKNPEIRKKISLSQIGKVPPYHFLRGKEHPDWKGITKEDKLRVGWSEWKRKRKEIIKRDIRCKLCKKDIGKLDVHHLDNNWKNNNNDNLILLCASCHKKCHKNIGLNLIIRKQREDLK